MGFRGGEHRRISDVEVTFSNLQRALRSRLVPDLIPEFLPSRSVLFPRRNGLKSLVFETPSLSFLPNFYFAPVFPGVFCPCVVLTPLLVYPLQCF